MENNRYPSNNIDRSFEIAEICGVFRDTTHINPPIKEWYMAADGTLKKVTNTFIAVDNTITEIKIKL